MPKYNMCHGKTSLHQELWTTVCELEMPVGCIQTGMKTSCHHLLTISTFSNGFNPLKFFISITVLSLRTIYLKLTRMERDTQSITFTKPSR